MFSICEICYKIFNYICPLDLVFEYEFIKFSVSFSEILNGAYEAGCKCRTGGREEGRHLKGWDGSSASAAFFVAVLL